MKYILIIGDGMADNPVAALKGRTPLEAAYKPTIDTLCQKSLLGSVSNVPKGMAAGSDTAILSIFGCDPRRYFTGRSPLEAAGCGCSVAAGEISYRCNMVSLEDGAAPFAQRRILSHNAGSIDGRTSQALIRHVMAEPVFAAEAEKVGLRLHPTDSFRHIALQKKGSLEGFCAPAPHDHLGEIIGPLLPHGCPTADGLRRLEAIAHEILEHHPLNEARRAAGKLPANGIWFWAEGTATALPDFRRRYGHFGSVISAVPLVHGIGALCGLKPVSVEGATGEVDTNYAGKVEAAKNCLRGGDDFLCLHLEAPDEATHNGSLDDKLLAIHQLDEQVVAPLTNWLRREGMAYRLLLLSDHKTLLATRSHDGDPVPFLLYDSTHPVGEGRSYTEQNGQMGPYLPDGTALMGLLFGA